MAPTCVARCQRSRSGSPDSTYAPRRRRPGLACTGCAVISLRGPRSTGRIVVTDSTHKDPLAATATSRTPSGSHPDVHLASPTKTRAGRTLSSGTHPVPRSAVRRGRRTTRASRRRLRRSGIRRSSLIRAIPSPGRRLPDSDVAAPSAAGWSDLRVRTAPFTPLSRKHSETSSRSSPRCSP